jgi:hypothetical protein
MPKMAAPWKCPKASHNNMFAISTLSMFRFPRERLTRMKLSTIAACFLAAICLSTSAADHTYNWSATHSRTWAGSDFWANRLQDWAVHDGRLECIADQSRLGVRTLHTLTHRLNDQTGRFQLDVTLGLANDTPATVNHHGLAGFLSVSVAIPWTTERPRIPRPWSWNTRGRTPQRFSGHPGFRTTRFSAVYC